MEKKSEVPEQNFTEGKAIHYLCSVQQCAKLSFTIKNFEKWRDVMVLNYLNLVLKRYWKSMEKDFLKCVGTLLKIKMHTHKGGLNFLIWTRVYKNLTVVLLYSSFNHLDNSHLGNSHPRQLPLRIKLQHRITATQDN